MLFLSKTEKTQWQEQANEIFAHHLTPEQTPYAGRANLRPIFYFYAGALLAAKGKNELGRNWINAGAMIEEDSLFLNTFLAGFLERQHGRLIMPEVVFADPRPYVHYTTVPIIKEARRRLLAQCGHTFPDCKHPFRMLDIGCGDGSLTAALLRHLLETGKINAIGEVLLIDPSAGMLNLAQDTLRQALPQTPIRAIQGKIEATAAQIDGHYDMALCSLSYHHMPYASKMKYLRELKPHLDNLILFELDANNDLPELQTPELALSIYQSYARMIDFAFQHDAPVEVAQNCVDRFLMTETVSLLTQPRGERNDYHMLRSQWLDLFEQILAPDFTRLCDSSCYEDEYFGLFTIHYGR